MKEEIHIYSTSRIKRLQDMVDKLKKEAKTYFQFTKKAMAVKPKSIEKPKDYPLSKPPDTMSKTPFVTTPDSPMLPNVIVSKGIEISEKPPEKSKKMISKKKLHLTKDLEEKMLVIALVSAIIFFILLGILLSYTNIF